MSFRPLSARGAANTRFDGLHENLPPWLHQPIENWFRPFITGFDPDGSYVEVEYLQDLQVRMRLRPPLNWFSAEDARADLLARMFQGSGKTALDVVDYALHFMEEYSPTKRLRQETVASLGHLLSNGGSVWEPTPVVAGSTWALTRRGTGPVRDAAQGVATANARVGEYLSQAWTHAFGRDPDPSGAYREAVRAVEAAAKPVVTPDDPLATLGKMIAAIEQKPEKWTFELGAPETVALMARAIWVSQRDRHGTDDASVPLSASPAQADAAVHLAVTLCQFFVSGAFRRA